VKEGRASTGGLKQNPSHPPGTNDSMAKKLLALTLTPELVDD
jgi:hypothetical protein